MRRKLLLINPVDYSTSNLASSHGIKYPPLGLGIIAALTPDDWEVEIIDENFTRFHTKPADLVAITANTPTACRAYHWASAFKKLGIHIVMGGIHPSMLPHEALNYADTVVVGEAENIWTKLIDDFVNNKIARIYEESAYHNLSNLPKPRRELFHPSYWLASVQTSRGCPEQCDFCSVSRFNGTKIRLRPVEEVLDEIETIKQKVIFFVDDNLFWNNDEIQQRTEELFRGILNRKIKKEWFTFAQAGCANNTELLKLAARSGCKMLIIGFESENELALKMSGKYINIEEAKNRYKTLIKKIHRCGIAVFGGIMYGFETDTQQDLRNRTNFAARSGIDVYHISTVTPFPGTPLYQKLYKEKRLLFQNYPEDWGKYNWKQLVFHHNLISKKEFDVCINHAHKKLYNKNRLKWKYLKTLWNTRKLKTARWAYFTNLSIREAYYPQARKHSDKNQNNI